MLIIDAVSPFAAAQNVSAEVRITRGRDYLLAHRNPDGGWPRTIGATAAPSDPIVTSEVLRAFSELHRSGRLGVEGAAAVSAAYVATMPTTDNLSRAHKLIAGQAAGVSVSVERDALFAARNADGGWGVTGVKQSNPIDTAIIIDALIGQGLGLAGLDLSHTRDYLLGTAQGATGMGTTPGATWPVSDDTDLSSPLRSAIVLLSLRDLREFSNVGLTVVPVIQQASAHVRQAAAPTNVAFADSPFEQCAMLRAVGGMGNPADLQVLLNRVGAAQDANGAWLHNGAVDGDVFVTAAAVRAINAAVPPPPGGPQFDLDVPVDSLSLQTNTSNGVDGGTAYFRIINHGPSAYDHELGAEADLYDGYPGAGARLLGSVPIPDIAAGGQADLAFDLGLASNLPFAENPAILTVFADVPGFRDVDPTNNTASHAFSVTGPDLTIQSEDVTAEYYATGSVHWRFWASPRFAGAAQYDDLVATFEALTVDTQQHIWGGTGQGEGQRLGSQFVVETGATIPMAPATQFILRCTITSIHSGMYRSADATINTATITPRRAMSITSVQFDQSPPRFGAAVTVTVMGTAAGTGNVQVSGMFEGVPMDRPSGAGYSDTRVVAGGAWTCVLHMYAPYGFETFDPSTGDPTGWMLWFHVTAQDDASQTGRAFWPPPGSSMPPWTYAPAPDLTVERTPLMWVSALNLDETPTVTLGAVIRNVGLTPSTAATVDFTQLPSTSIGQAQAIPALQPGESYVVSTYWTPSPQAASAMIHITPATTVPADASTANDSDQRRFFFTGTITPSLTWAPPAPTPPLNDRNIDESGVRFDVYPFGGDGDGIRYDAVLTLNALTLGSQQSIVLEPDGQPDGNLHQIFRVRRAAIRDTLVPGPFQVTAEITRITSDLVNHGPPVIEFLASISTDPFDVGQTARIASVIPAVLPDSVPISPPVTNLPLVIQLETHANQAFQATVQVFYPDNASSPLAQTSVSVGVGHLIQVVAMPLSGVTIGAVGPHAIRVQAQAAGVPTYPEWHSGTTMFFVDQHLAYRFDNNTTPAKWFDQPPPPLAPRDGESIQAHIRIIKQE